MNTMKKCLASRLVAIVTVLVVAMVAAGAGAQSQPAISIPPSDEKAPQALLDSPRHGEWVDIALPGSDTKLKTWVVYPERKDKAAVVIVIHEIFGLTDWIRAVTDQLAADGFIAIAPDLLSGKGPNGGGTDSFEGDKVRDAIRGLKPEEVEQRLNAIREYALALPAASGKSATVGFCWGGSTSFAYATKQPKLNAAVVYYGTAPTAKESFANVACPVLGLYGSDDARVTSTVESTTASMKEHDKPYSPHTYENAGHGFLRQQTGREGANLKAAQQAWSETVAFLKKHCD